MSDDLITRLLRNLGKKNQNKLVAETERLMAEDYGIDVAAELEAIKAQDVPEIAAAYYFLLKAVYRGKKPKQVRLEPDDRFVVLVDGIRYDFQKKIRRHDRKNRQYMQKIDFLLQDTFWPDVQSQLSEKIQREW